MTDFSLRSWEAISTVVTAVGVLTALGLGVWANWLQYRQAKLHARQSKILARAWASGLSSEVANTLVRAKKLRVQMESDADASSHRSLLVHCKRARLIEASYIEPFLSRVDVFPAEVSQGLVVFFVNTKRLAYVVGRIESGGAVSLPDGSGAYPVMLKTIESIISWGDSVLAGLYSMSHDVSPPDLEEIARESFERDLAKVDD